MKHTASAYRNGLCRCDTCRDDHRDRQHRETMRRRDLTRANGGTAPIPVHNRNTYVNWHCRCPTCTAANIDALREWKAAHQ